MAYDYVGTTASESVNHSGDEANKTWDFSQGGDDTLIGGSGANIFFMGATLTENDQIYGSLAAEQSLSVVELAGNYYSRPGDGSFPLSYTLSLTNSTLHNVLTIQLDEGAGFGYDIALPSNDFADYGADTTTASIYAGGLTSAGETIDGSLAVYDIRYTTGTGSYVLVDGSGDSSFDLTNGYVAGDQVDGGSGNDTIFLAAVTGPIAMSASGISHIDSIFLYSAQVYSITVDDSGISADSIVTITDLASGATIDFDGSAVTIAAFDIDAPSGGRTLSGGGGNDTLDARYANSSQVLSGGGGDDLIWGNVSGHTAQVDGGAGRDTLELYVPVNQTTTITPSLAGNIEVLELHTNSGNPNTSRVSIVWQNNILGAGQVIAIAASQPDANPMPGSFDVLSGAWEYDFDGSAETHGSFIFTLPKVETVNGSHWTGGSGNDIFISGEPLHINANGNVWNGGGGVNTLDYSSDDQGMTIDAAAGTAQGHAYSFIDQFSHFQVFKFGAGDNSFTGAAGAETAYMLAAGEDAVAAGGGNDVIYMGASLDAFDLIDGGANADTVVLDGNYAAGVTLSSLTLTNVETLKLQHLSGEPVYSYKLTTNDGNVAAGATLAVDGSALPTGGTLNFNGSAELDGHFSLRGGAGADTLAGGHLADTLNGGVGADSMVGGAGNDLFYVDNAGDKTIETVGGGTDTVFSSISYALQTGQSIELLATTSRAGTGAINLTGNELAQRIDGNYGNNILNGHGGGDTLYGFQGNDTFYVSSATDKVFESADQGSDTVFASVSYTLQNGQSVEYLATTSRLGTGTITLTGNEQAQRIDGNYGVNGLYGGDGNDTLYGFDGNDKLGGGNGRDLMDGGNGNDIFTYSAVIQSTGVNRDLIQNMNFAQDKFDLPAIPTGIDTKVIVGTLSDASFDTDLVHAIGAAQLATHHAVLFDPSAGTDNIAGHMFLIVDVNGVAGYQAGQDYVIELQSAAGSLTLGDFV